MKVYKDLEILVEYLHNRYGKNELYDFKNNDDWGIQAIFEDADGDLWMIAHAVGRDELDYWCMQSNEIDKLKDALKGK